MFYHKFHENKFIKYMNKKYCNHIFYKTKLIIQSPLVSIRQHVHEIEIDDFIEWCNIFSKNNPKIYILLPIQYHITIFIEKILQSIYNTISLIFNSDNKTIIRKMQIRYTQTGFPITICTNCINTLQNNITNHFVNITKKYPIFLCQYFGIIHNYSKIIKHPHQLYCKHCIESYKQINNITFMLRTLLL